MAAVALLPYDDGGDVVNAFGRLQLVDDDNDQAPGVRILPATMAFFTSRGFRCRAGEEALECLHRMSTERHWGSKTFKKRKREFDEEIARRTQLNLAKREVLLEVVRRFNLHVGPGAPPSNKQCERLIATTLYANIYDLISGRYHNYRTAAALKQYSVDNEKLFSKSQAKTNPVHRLLLHKLF